MKSFLSDCTEICSAVDLRPMLNFAFVISFFFIDRRY